jgi:hypothetical protein
MSEAVLVCVILSVQVVVLVCLAVLIISLSKLHSSANRRLEQLSRADGLPDPKEER